MATMTATYRPIRFNVLLFLLVVSIAFTGLWGVKTSISHAVEKHGEEAVQVRNCLDSGKAFQVWKNKSTKHLAEVCFIDQGEFERWGIRISKQINGIFEEITAFIEEGDIASVEEYLIRRGYTNIH